MGDKKESIYSSSQEAFWKIMVLVFSFGISIVASLLDDKSCYIAILVQAVNNIYDFYPMTNKRLYTNTGFNCTICDMERLPSKYRKRGW